MNCDLCNTAVDGTIVNASDMSNAARKGFNPYKCGLVPEIMRQIARPGFEERWTQRAIDGDASHSDWNVCANCMVKLLPYLQGAQQVTLDKSRQDEIDQTSASLIAEGAPVDIVNWAARTVRSLGQNAPPPQPRKWWQFWK